MSVKNTRQKGRKLVKKALEKIRQIFPTAYEVVGSGAGKDKGDIRIPSLDLVIEVKNQKRIRMTEWVEQSEREGLGYSYTALMWKKPDSPTENPEIRVDIPLDYFLDLLKAYEEPRIREGDRELSYHLYKLKKDCDTVIKLLK